MKKQNGFSQIVIMVVMLILAIALPVTANLVKKVQDNRSSAATETIYQGLICTGPQKGNVVCQGSTTFKCTEEISTNGPVWKKVADDCSCTRFNDSGSCTAISGCAWGYVGSSMSCHAITSTCSATNCTACGVDRCTEVGCAWGYVGSSLSCSKPSTSTPAPSTPSNPGSGVPSNVTCGADNITATFVTGANCTKAGGICGDFSSTPKAGSSCRITGQTCGTIKDGLCPGDTTVKCCVASTAAPAPVNPGPSGCGAVRNQCDGNNLNHCDGTNWSLVTTCKAGCDGSNNTCKDECTIGQTPTCSNSTTRQFCNKDADGGIRLKTENCANGCGVGPTGAVCNETISCEGSIYLKQYSDVAKDSFYGKNPRAHYNLKDSARIWSSATCIGDVAYNCDAGHPSPYNTQVCQYGCSSSNPGHCNGAPAPDCSDAGNYCWNKPYKTGCLGTKLAVHNNCADKANYCAGEYYATAEAQLNKDVTGEICGDPKGCIGTKVCTTPTPVNGALGPANGTIVTTKPTSSGACSAGNVTWTDDNATDGTYNWTCAGTNGGTSVSGSANKADCTTGSQKCTTDNKYYTCTDGLWAHSTTTTACATGKICTSGDIGTAVCKDPAYVAPSFDILFAISGVKAVTPCLGDLKFKVAVAKDGLSNQITSEMTAVSVGTTNYLGDAIFKINNFALSNNYALTDKIKIYIGGKKSLVTIYGKNNQIVGFPAMNTSQILVSDLATDKRIALYKYPVLNGDVGSEGHIGVLDNIVNSVDFALMKTQWHTKCNNGQNLESDLDGDCYVGSSDLQIQKNAMAEQIAQKTF